MLVTSLLILTVGTSVAPPRDIGAVRVIDVVVIASNVVAAAATSVEIGRGTKAGLAYLSLSAALTGCAATAASFVLLNRKGSAFWLYVVPLIVGSMTNVSLGLTQVLRSWSAAIEPIEDGAVGTVALAW